MQGQLDDAPSQTGPTFPQTLANHLVGSYPYPKHQTALYVASRCLYGGI